MNTYIKTASLIFTLVAGTIWMDGCKKSSPSIVGKWTATSYKYWKDSNNVIIHNYTFENSSPNDTFAFYANGRCALARYPSPLYGSYKLVGNTVFIYDTISNFPTQIIDTIVSLTEHALVFSTKVGISYGISNNNADTTIYTYHYTLGYSR